MLLRWGWVHDLVGIVVLGRCGACFGVQESMHWPSKLRISKEREVEACAVSAVVSHVLWVCGSRRLLQEHLHLATPSTMPVAIVYLYVASAVAC